MDMTVQTSYKTMLFTVTDAPHIPRVGEFVELPYGGSSEVLTVRYNFEAHHVIVEVE